MYACAIEYETSGVDILIGQLKIISEFGDNFANNRLLTDEQSFYFLFLHLLLHIISVIILKI